MIYVCTISTNTGILLSAVLEGAKTVYGPNDTKSSNSPALFTRRTKYVAPAFLATCTRLRAVRRKGSQVKVEDWKEESRRGTGGEQKRNWRKEEKNSVGRAITLL